MSKVKVNGKSNRFFWTERIDIRRSNCCHFVINPRLHRSKKQLTLWFMSTAGGDNHCREFSCAGRGLCFLRAFFLCYCLAQETGCVKHSYRAYKFLHPYCIMTSYTCCPFVSVKAVYNELHHTLMSISELDDLKWWKNNRGPGMPTDWPKIEVSQNLNSNA